ncbi:hypothetical protein EG68_02870 [Paragonimus skrjabini miyazakii]|uniref:Uncharacterized protein n=1 Tax=Paragonimus skrjabini miyazakii TaxID=59628 RepID=A0A8S9YXW8_9TREM|nr:hypothetical protein EG68_02870 [Paragonimus skrjabini miyazakii]
MASTPKVVWKHVNSAKFTNDSNHTYRPSTVSETCSRQLYLCRSSGYQQEPPYIVNGFIKPACLAARCI